MLIFWNNLHRFNRKSLSSFEYLFHIVSVIMNNQAYDSPPLGFQPRNQLQSTPKFHQNNRFQRSPQPRSPGFNGHFPRNSSPYHAYHNQSKSFNSSTNSSPGEWNSRYNQSYSSNSSTSYFGDVSQLSPHYSPNRNNSSPYHSQNRNKRFQVWL